LAAETSSRRSQLIAEARTFVQAARQLSGVTRIALLGTITTGNPDPKDVDLLVTVDDEMDLTELATLGRRLSGRLQSRASGADIFLASPGNRYLGRLCLWRECAPGIRLSCDALNCGRCGRGSLSQCEASQVEAVGPPTRIHQ
jgi:predicted nucleotidyltransferase